MVAPVAISSSGYFDALSVQHGVQPAAFSSGGSFGAMAIRQVYDALVVPVDWGSGMLERLEWLTDTQTAFDGSESRIRLREFPRRTLEFGYGASGRDRQRFDSFLYGRGAKAFACPIWTDGQDLETPATTGDVLVQVATEHRDFQAGALVFLIGHDGEFEAAEIKEVNADSVELRQPLASSWAAGVTIYPGRIGRLPPSQAVARFTGDHVLGRFRVSLEGDNEWAEATESTTYRGLPVMVYEPNWVGNVDTDHLRKLAELDFGTGRRAFYDESKKPEIVQGMRWMLSTRERVAAFKSWAYTRAGKYRALWVPTWVPDLTLISNLGSGGTSFDIVNIGYARQIARGVHRRDLRIELKSGAVYFRRITAAAAVDADSETLSIDSALGVAITPASVNRISFMALSRMEGDGVELSWFTGDAAQAVTNMKATGNDV